MRYYPKSGIYSFSDEEKAEAHNISVIDYLQRNYSFNFKKVHGGYRCEQHNSLFVHNDEKSWYWNSHGFGGGDVIAFVQKYENKSYAEALVEILKPSVPSEQRTYTKAPENKLEPQERELILPPKKNGKFNRAFAYLTQTRCIDQSIVTLLLHKKFIYEDMRGNVVFVGYNKQGFPAYASVRSTNTNHRFRREAVGSDKNNGFYINGFDKSKVYVFEAPIDLLSHATMKNISTGDSKAWLNDTRISLGGVCDNALEHYLSEHSDVKEIRFCLDNDSAGNEATEKYMQKYSKRGYSVVSEPPASKDYNEDLQAMIKSGKALTYIKK